MMVRMRMKTTTTTATTTTMTMTMTMTGARGVTVRRGEVTLPTYLPAVPDRNPMFLEKRVYQGSSGRVYPLPFTDRISDRREERAWKAIWIENEFLEVLLLPELGGRIHAAVDKTNGYDFIYRQTVIKPALVGLAGPWLSGGIEFNWPQHHRPATFLPVDVDVEEHSDGAVTVWMGDHDPMARMKGMHGVCLHPGKAYLELRVRLYNRTPYVQTFLWWANVATRVHEGYQSFFPPDARYVADHAKRATTSYPLCDGVYYGVNYADRAMFGVPKWEWPGQFAPPSCGGKAPVDYPANDLSWYANIPTPCSYMCVGSKGEFFGGYDHFRRAGLVHVANRHISPGKKQWTWGNHAFGYAWDRNLTETDGPYIELMAGVFTDNQPDFSFLQPGETRVFSQYWYPIQETGPACHATLDAALGRMGFGGAYGEGRVALSVSAAFPGARVILTRGEARGEWTADLAPGKPFVLEGAAIPEALRGVGLTVRLVGGDGRELLRYDYELSLIHI